MVRVLISYMGAYCQESASGLDVHLLSQGHKNWTYGHKASSIDIKISQYTYIEI